MPCIDPFTIRPVERDCRCAGGGGHAPECDAAFKAKLLGAKAVLRELHAELDAAPYN
jgi:hypothetical protein